MTTTIIKTTKTQQQKIQKKTLTVTAIKNVILPPVIYEVTVIMLNTIHKLTL